MMQYFFKKILIGIPVKNTGKYLYHLFDQLVKLNYDLSLITIILVEGDSNDNSYEICNEIKLKYKIFFNIIVAKLNFGFDLNHNNDRYQLSIFPTRIKNLTVTRNFIVDNYLNDNDYIWWIDSDFENIPSDTLNKLIECNKDIVIPTLIHDTWGYHDCGSVIFDGKQQIRFQYIDTKENLIKLDRTDAHCFIKSNVFSNLRYKFIDEEYLDGCGSKQNCLPEGVSFSLEAVKCGYELYGTKHIIIKHHDI